MICSENKRVKSELHFFNRLMNNKPLWLVCKNLAGTALIILTFTFEAVTVSAQDLISIYVLPAITDEKILPTSYIPYDYSSNKISIVASPGEYEPASFVIRANEAVTSLVVEATDLSGNNGNIPSGNIDIRVVKCWYQAGNEMWDVTYKILTPELLLKDDSLVKVENGENYLKKTTGDYVWISKVSTGTAMAIIPIADLPVKDGAILLPVNIPINTNKQFWVTVKIPDGAIAGSYQGNIQLKTFSGTIGEIQLKVEVLPIMLPRPDLTYSIYYRGRLTTNGSISSEDKTEEQLRAELKDMLIHGVASPDVYPQGSDQNLKRVLGMCQELGLDIQTLYYLGLQIHSYGQICPVKV